MTTVTKWSIKIEKDGTPYISMVDERYQIKKKLRFASEDIIFTQDGIRSKKPQEYECLYKYLDRKQSPTPLSELVKLGEIAEEKPHSLTFLYELLSGVAIRTKPVIKLEPLNVDALLKKYSYLGEQISGVDFYGVAKDLDRHLRG